MRYLALTAVLLSSGTMAQTVGIAVPQANQSSFNYDEVRSSSGTTCRQAMGSNIALEVGAVGSDAGTDGNFADIDNNFNTGTDGGAIYARVTYFLGAPKRLDCARLYELEIETLRRQLESLQDSYVISENIHPQ